VLETNLRGAMWLTQMLLPRMFEQDFGDIVNVSSQAGKNGYADVPSYCASKFGLLGFAESVRDDVKKRGANVRVFNFCPGLVDVETPAEDAPREGFIHVRNMAKTLIYALSLDRNVILEDINIYSR
jgi:3-oxoacyl-[acyl-carrier protein] reductase